MCDTLSIEGNMAFPPYEFINKNGEPDGLNVDLAKEIMKRMKVPYVIRLKKWSDVLTSFKKGEVDLILGMNISSERMKIYKFGPIHGYVYQVAIFRKETPPIHTLSQFKNKRIIVLYKTISEEFLRKAGYTENQFHFCENMEEGLTQLSQGKYDVAICDRNVAVGLLQKNKFDNLFYTNLDIPPQEYCFAGRNQKILDSVGRAFFSMKEDGTYDKLHAKWISHGKSFFNLKIIIPIVGVVIFIGCVLISFIVLLRFKVRTAQHELSVKNKRLLMALHAGNLVAWRYDLKTNSFFKIDGNKFSEEGYSYEKFMECIHPDDKQKLDEVLMNSCGGNVPDKPLCVRVDRKKTGCYRIISKEFSLTYTSGGKIESVVEIDKDITESVSMQKKLEDSIRKMELAVKYSNTVFWEYEVTSGFYRFYSNTLATYQDVSKVTSSEILEKVHSEDKKKIKKFLDSVALGEDETLFADVRIESSNFQGWRYCRPIATAFTRDPNTGKVLLYVGFTCDYTAIYELNKEVRDYANKMDLLIRSSKVKLWSYNRRSHTLKIMKDDETFNCAPGEIINWGEDKEFTKQVFERMDKGDLDKFSAHGQYQKDGEMYYMQTDIIPLINEEGNVTEYFGSMRDITDLIETQKKLEKEKERAQQSDNLKSAFLTNMNHEIRTPLNSIVGFSQILADSCTELTLEERQDFSKRIIYNNNNLLDIISNVIDVAQMESDNIVSFTQPYSLNTICSDVVEKMKHKSMEGVSMEFTEHEQNFMLKTDRYRLVQLLSSYLSNAAKFTAYGRIDLDYTVDDKNKQVIFSVTDTGIGVPAEKAEVIFERFEKLDKFADGTGLGLYLCKIISEALNGKALLDTSYHEGARFLFVHPIK